MPPSFKRLASLAAFAGLALLAGCQSAKIAQPLTGKLAGNDPGTQMDFWHSLENRPLVSNDEAFHGLILFLDGQDTAKDYAGRVARLSTAKIPLLPGGFHEPAEVAVSRGTLSVALVGVLHIKGGLMLHVLPTSPRYATRELVFMGIYPTSSEQQTFNGAEFVGLIARAEDYQKDHAPVPPAAAPATAPAPKSKA